MKRVALSLPAFAAMVFFLSTTSLAEQEVHNSDLEKVIGKSNVIVRGKVIKTEEEVVIKHPNDKSEFFCYVTLDDCLFGHPDTNEVIISNLNHILAVEGRHPTVKIGQWISSSEARRPCTLRQERIWFLRLYPNATDIYEILDTRDVSEESAVRSLLNLKK